MEDCVSSTEACAWERCAWSAHHSWFTPAAPYVSQPPEGREGAGMAQARTDLMRDSSR